MELTFLEYEWSPFFLIIVHNYYIENTTFKTLKIKSIKMKVLEVYSKTLRYRGYAKSSIETYVCYLEKFLIECEIKDPYQVSTSQIEGYLINKEYSSRSQQNQIIGSLKLFLKYILKKSDKHLKKIERPRKEKRLPKIIDQDWLIEQIRLIPNLKHKTIIATAFSCGLRVSEIINLKIVDVDSHRMLININNAKGGKDRIVPLTDYILNLLREYYKAYLPNEFMFNGQFKLQYSSTSCNKIVKKYLGEEYHFHLLRHSGLTAMLENGTDSRVIQRIAGHSSPKTTDGYFHVSTSILKQARQAI